MAHVPSTDGRLSRNDGDEQPNAEAKIARLQLLKDRYGPFCRDVVPALSICAIVALMLYEQPAREVALDGTLRMDRVAEELDRAQAMPPHSVQQIARLLREPLYDCAQVACGAVLKSRNRIAREKLEAILAKASPSLVVSAKLTPFGATRVIERR
ncbi:MAG TPA: hypothetical protein VFL51_09515 [Pseudolabrys sp.]|nr:hypothetical protein [Pseudolabrys sp.]